MNTDRYKGEKIHLGFSNPTKEESEWYQKLNAVRNGRSFGLKTLRMDQVDNSVWGDKRIYTDGLVWGIGPDGWHLSEEAQMIYDKLSEEKYGERKVVEYDLDWEI